MTASITESGDREAMGFTRAQPVLRTNDSADRNDILRKSPRAKMQ